jgi:transglutaminase-like putative cysteine protease
MTMETIERTWQGAALDACTRRGVIRRESVLSLRRGVTLADEAGRCNTRDGEWLAGLRQARKQFIIDEPIAAERAKLSVYLRCETEDGELVAAVNGHETVIRWQTTRPYWEDAWHAIDIDPAWLQQGANEILFRALGEARWMLLIEESRLPDRSEVSDDGGQTWRSQEMGANDRADGEYLVRLWLEQHVAAGEVTSTVVDLLDVDGAGVSRGVSGLGQAHNVRVVVDGEFPAGTSAQLEWRAGSTPAYAPQSWSAWAALAAEGTGVPPEARFLQWRVLLGTSDPAVTPLLAGVALFAEVETGPAVTSKVVHADNRDLIYGSYRFSHLQADDERGRILRERWKLDQVVGPAKTEFEAMVRLSQWVREQWEDGWNRGHLQYCPPWDALLILELASQKLSLGMCTHYATVFTQCCAALGFTSRTLVVRAHCVSEVWSNDFGKWVTMDTGGDSNDATKYTYHFEREGVPLSAREAHRAWVDEDLDGVVMSPPAPAAATGHTVAKRIHLWERFMMNPRNDEPATLGPGEPENGQGAYHYDGYLFWEDDKTVPLPWYSRHTDRLGDFEWDEDRVRIHLQAADEGLRVDLEGVCANLQRLEVRLDGGGWEERPAKFTWTPGAGEHRLEARTVNAFGRAGMTSSVTVQS